MYADSNYRTLIHIEEESKPVLAEFTLIMFKQHDNVDPILADARSQLESLQNLVS